MDRNSWSSPTVVDDLLAVADRHLGQGTTDRFLTAFDATGHRDELAKPMLRSVGQWSDRPLAGADARRVSAWRIDNPRPAPAEILLSPAFPKGSVESVFQRFAQSTAHANAVGDFRDLPQRYAPIFLGPRYVVFHGDGHCIALANLLAALLRRLAGATVEVLYTATENRSFVHAFVEWQDHGRRMILDGDQKTMTEWDRVGPPYAMIYQILSMAGARIYEGVPERDRNWLFAPVTRDYFARFHRDGAGNPPRIYHPSPTPSILSALFAEARAHRLEPVSLKADDYPWKARFRRATAEEELLSQLDRPLHLRLPPGGSLVVGLDAEPLPEEARLYPRIFFGRVPAVIRAEIPSGGRLALALPERPWFMCMPGGLDEVGVNGRSRRTHPVGAFAALGAGDIDELIDEPGVAGSASCAIDGPPGTTIRVVLPFNGLAYNAGTIDVAADAPASVRLAA